MFMSGFEIRIMTHKMNGEVAVSSLFSERVFMIALISFLNVRYPSPAKPSGPAVFFAGRSVGLMIQGVATAGLRCEDTDRVFLVSRYQFLHRSLHCPALCFSLGDC